MENFNIPAYRAKRVDNGEYVMGWYSDPILIKGKLYLSITNKEGTFRIDPTTLAIHFPDMLNSQGNKIFASLSEDGKGGSLIEGDSGTKHFSFTMEDIYLYKKNYSICKVIGIQE